MSRFLLRCTITAICAVTMPSATALAQSDSTSRELATRTMPTIMVPVSSGAPTWAADVSRSPVVPPAVETNIEPRPVNGDVASVARRRAAFSRPAVLMITGGALLLTGLLVDGDASSILIIAGAGIGGYGLYLHLQSPNARP